MIEERDLSTRQLACLRTIYKELQTSESQALVANSDDAERITELLADCDKQFPFARPERDYMLKIVVEVSARGRCEEDIDTIANELEYGFTHDKIDQTYIVDYSIHEQ